MTVQFKNYTHTSGFSAEFHNVRDFLVRINQTNPIAYDFEWGRWEWAFSLPYLDTSALAKIGLWEDDGQLVALAAYEESPDRIYICIDPAYTSLKADILTYVTRAFGETIDNVRVLINQTDDEMQLIAAEMGYKPTQEEEPNAVIDIKPEKLAYSLPDGFLIISVADGVDLVKFNRLLWRGFNHEGEPPSTPQDLDHRRQSLSGPHLNPDLCILVVAPSGAYASYCGMWYDPTTEYALVEPVATDPDFRRMGLGRAAVLEGILRCGQLGAKLAYVGSSLQFYYQIGFRPVPTSRFWKRG